MSFHILGQGGAVPETAIDQSEAAGIAVALCCRTQEQRTWLPLMYEHSGIQTRNIQYRGQLVRDLINGTRSGESIFFPTGDPDDRGPTTGQRNAVYTRKAGPLVLQAAQAALKEGDVDPARVTHLVTVSCTGFNAPGVDLALIGGLTLPPTVQRTHIGFMGCHGALNALRVANAFTGADPSAVALVCAVELCSLHYHYGWDPEKMIANALFADGAAAIVGAAKGPRDAWRLAANGSVILPNSTDAMTWTIGDHGFEMTLSKRVPQLIGEHLRPWLQKWLAAHGVDWRSVRSWAIHPGGPKILEAVEAALDLPGGATAAARAVFAEHGNMSSPTVLYIIDRLRIARAPRPCVALGFGPGLAAEAALFV
jgi:predicted naringenin-chalcone synthase